MVSRGFTVVLALLRIAAGLSLFLAGVHKLSWFAHPEALQHAFAQFGEHAANGLVARYVGWVSPHYALFARLVATGELVVGVLLMLGLLTPLAALLGFLMVLNFQFIAGHPFSLKYVTGEAGLVYVLVYPVLMLGRAGSSLGLDGVLASARRRASGA